MNQHSVLSYFLASAMLASAPAMAEGTDANPLLTTDGTTGHEVIASPVRHNGFDGLQVKVSPDHKELEQGGCDNCTVLMIDDIDFGNGTIELEVSGAPAKDAGEGARGFVGVVFRAEADASQFEGIYLRPTNSDAEEQIRRNHSVQYFSYPEYPWHVLREQSPGHYESHADIGPDQWTKMRIDVNGAEARQYLNGSDKPTLIVKDMKLGADRRGKVGLFTEPGTDAFYRNLVVTHR